MSRRLGWSFVLALFALSISATVALELVTLRAELARNVARALDVTVVTRDPLTLDSSLVSMNTDDAATIYHESKQILWASGNGECVWKAGSFIPPRGPSGGLLMVKRIVVHAVLNITVATATEAGADRYRFARNINVELVGSSDKPYENITGDTLRTIGYSQLGPGSQFEHQDMAVAAAANYNFTAVVPLSHDWAYDPNDSAVPSEFLDKIRVGMANATDMAAGSTSVLTINSGYYWLVAECYETQSIILNPISVWRQVDALTTSQVDHEIDLGGHLMDLFFFVPGASGGQTLANLSKAGIQFLQDYKLLKDPTLKHIFARAREAESNLFSTTGNPVTTNPFCASDTGTLRALAIRLTTGSKTTDGPELAKATAKLELSAALPAAGRLVARFVRPKSEAQRAIIEATHRASGDMWYVKTRDKSRRGLSQWPEDMRKYLPEKWGKRR